MSVLIETTLGDIVIELYKNKCPMICKNFLKLCKIKYYDGCLFHTVQRDFIAQTGDRTGTGSGGDSIYKFLHGEKYRFFPGEIPLDSKPLKKGSVAMAMSSDGDKNLIGSQFYITLGNDLRGNHIVFGNIAEGFETLSKINEVVVDGQNRPCPDIRITQACVVEDDFEDPPELAKIVLDASPKGVPKEEVRDGSRLGHDWVPMDEKLGPAELEEVMREKAAHSSAVVLESIGDIPYAEVEPPKNVLHVWDLNPETEDEDLHTLFSQFGTVVSAKVIRDFKTGKSLSYAFIEFEKEEASVEALSKMEGVKVDDRQIHVNFSQSVSKLSSALRFKVKGNRCFKGSSTDHVAKYCGSNQSSKHIVKDRNRGSERGYDMVFEGESSKRKKRDYGHDREKSRRRSHHNYGESKRRDRDERDTYDKADIYNGRRRHKEELREESYSGKRKRQYGR